MRLRRRKPRLPQFNGRMFHLGATMKMVGLVLAGLVLLSLSGCEAPPRFDICKYRGNSSSENFCVVSYVYLMAHPEQFEGRDVEFRAWARVASDATLFFPTREAMDDGESVSSMVAYGEAVASDLIEREGVARVLVRGRFYLSEGKVHPLDAERLGVIQNAVILP